MGVSVQSFKKITLYKDSLFYFGNTRVSIEVVVDGGVCGLGHGLDGLLTGRGKQDVSVHLH
jgi:hypothetical protein